MRQDESRLVLAVQIAAQLQRGIALGTVYEDGNRRQLVEKLAEMGINETETNINNKISRGGFTAVFFVQCLIAIGCANLRLEDF